ncbi:hypothetical protein FHS42_006947 [Streptomyces zagrosensis]|uniref:Uncharacterized protein n=1 Tax=Streptomyces zagrosensis TaxID=1042984 RepID=A0A7W9QGI1_9ACTN|nr:hypothetical protein [Streptomyces zagrosensis]
MATVGEARDPPAAQACARGGGTAVLGERSSHHPARFSGSRTGSIGTAVRSAQATRGMARIACIV